MSDQSRERLDYGAMYIASREPFISEAGRSAESVRNHHTEIPIVLYAPPDAETPSVFDDVRTLKEFEHDFSDSNLTSDRIPFDRTLFLDSDTYVCGSIDAVFDVLDGHDLAAAQDPTRTGTVEHTHEHDVPDCYPQYNTGVVAFRDTDVVRQLFDRWNELYAKADGVAHGLNQPAFRMAAYDSDAQIAALPPEWNYRWGMTGNRVGYACGDIHVLHGRSAHWDVETLANMLNETSERRAIVIGETDARVITQENATSYSRIGDLVERAYWRRQKDGLTGLALGAGRTIMGVKK